MDNSDEIITTFFLRSKISNCFSNEIKKNIGISSPFWEVCEQYDRLTVSKMHFIQGKLGKK